MDFEKLLEDDESDDKRKKYKTETDWLTEFRKIVEKKLLVQVSKVDFPFLNVYGEWPTVYFQKLKNHSPTYHNDKYCLSGYYDNSYIPLFKGKYTYISTELFNSADLVVDYFFEHERLSYSKPGRLSPLTAWKNPKYLSKIVHKYSFDFSCHENLRKAILSTISDVPYFRPTWSLSIMKLLNISSNQVNKQISILDVYTGWSDRLFSAMALGVKYKGFPMLKNYNTNAENLCHKLDLINMKELSICTQVNAYLTLIKMFGKDTLQTIEPVTFTENINNTEKYSQVYFIPRREDYYHIINLGLTENENLINWTQQYIGDLIKSWQYVDLNGYLIVHICDCKNFWICDPVYLLIDQYFKGSSYQGVIGVTTDEKIYPVWIWKKVESSPLPEKTLPFLYPDFYSVSKKYL
jgi:hypothetical protein